MKNGNFLLLTLAYSLQLGLYSGWSGLLDPILVRLGCLGMEMGCLVIAPCPCIEA
jgi:hypothetical protein